MSDQTNWDNEDMAPTLQSFEAKLVNSAPQPRDEFEIELAQRLQQEFIQRKQSRKFLTALHPRKYQKLSIRAVLTLVAVLVIGIGVVIAVNSILQQFVDYDAGLKAIYEQGLGHEIGISQSHEGYTVTLEWAYADGNRLILAYVIQGHAGTQYTNLSSDHFSLTLRDTGEEIPFSQGMTGAAIDQLGEFIGFDERDEIHTSDRSLLILTYDLSEIDTANRSTLDLQLEVTVYGVTLQQRTQMPIDRFDDMKDGPDASFIFDFSVDLTAERRIFNSPLDAHDQGVTVHLREVSVAPSQTRVVVCFTPPDSARQWTAIPQLMTADGEVPGGGAVRPYMDGEESCQDYTYYAGLFNYTGEWQLEITELVGFGGSSEDQQRISGSWAFEFVVP